MNYYIEFNGRKLGESDCLSYNEAQNLVFKILVQCLQTYRKLYSQKTSSQTDERVLQEKILAQLKISYCQPRWSLRKNLDLKPRTLQKSRHLSQVHRNYIDVKDL